MQNQTAGRRFHGGILIALLAADAGFVAAHLIGEWLTPDRDVWKMLSIFYDRSFPEMFGYLKWIATAVLLVMAGRRLEQPVLYWLAALVTFMLLDDSLRLHENLAGWLRESFTLPRIAGLREQDSGELIFAAGFVVLLLLPLILRILRSDLAGQRMAVGFLVLLVLFGLCAVVFDMLHSAMPDGWMRESMGFLEDGGEMIAQSLMVAYAWVLARPGDATRPA